MASTLRRLLGGGTLLLAFLLTSPSGHAKEKKAGEKKIRVTVLVIVASESNPKTDRRLRCIADQVVKINENLVGFQLAKMVCKSIEPKTKAKFDLIGKQAIQLEVQRGTDKNERIQVRLTPPFLGEITYKTPCGKFLPIVTRYRPKDDELLILAIRVQPCPGER